LFFYASVTHRPPPSFPTRRSSDLCGCRSDARLAERRIGSRNVYSGSPPRLERVPSGWRSGEGAAPLPKQPRYRQLVRRRHQLVRSEEHTSELQSPCNLVCRLLLEK